jgi:hypothetical protein
MFFVVRLILRELHFIYNNKLYMFKFVRITSGFGGGEFTKTLRKVCTCQKLKFAFLLLEYCKIRECYAVANAFTIRNMYRSVLVSNPIFPKMVHLYQSNTSIYTAIVLFEQSKCVNSIFTSDKRSLTVYNI